MINQQGFVDSADAKAAQRHPLFVECIQVQLLHPRDIPDENYVWRMLILEEADMTRLLVLLLQLIDAAMGIGNKPPLTNSFCFELMVGVPFAFVDVVFVRIAGSESTWGGRLWY